MHDSNKCMVGADKFDQAHQIITSLCQVVEEIVFIAYLT